MQNEQPQQPLWIIINFLQVIEWVFSMKFVKFRVLRIVWMKKVYVMEPPGIELGTFDVQSERASRLSYSAGRELDAIKL